MESYVYEWNGLSCMIYGLDLPMFVFGSIPFLLSNFLRRKSCLKIKHKLYSMKVSTNQHV